MLDQLVRSVLAAAEPRACLSRAWPADLDGPVCVVAVGKASVGLAAAAREQLGGRLVSGIVTVVPGLATGRTLDPRFAVFEADHPLATERNVAAARAVLAFVRGVPREATLLVLLSGGGSAHLTLPAGGLTLEDLRDVTRGLQRAGATIAELNAVRKHCERLKGGRLAAACGAGRIVTLAMSDVEGDAADVIASGPTVGDPTTYADALTALDRHGVGVKSVRGHLEEGVRGLQPETLKAGDEALASVSWRVIANNRTVLDAAASAAAGLNCFVVREHAFVTGDAAAAGARFGATLVEIACRHERACLIAGGEPVVNVGEAKGVGGPSQEFALAAAKAIAGVKGVRLAAVSTDGADGPPEGGNDHAGAVADWTTVERARTLGLDAGDALATHDSATFFARLGDAIRTGPTGTNLNHVFIGVVDAAFADRATS